MRRSARTDLCGGRSAMIVPTASTIPEFRYCIRGNGKGKNFLGKILGFSPSSSNFRNFYPC